VTTDTDQVLHEHGGALARTVGLYARAGAERDDLLQDTLLAVVTALHRFRGESSVRTYVLRIAHHCGLRHALRRRRLRAIEGELVDVAGSQPDPETTLVRSEELRRIDALLSSMPLVSRQVLALTLEGCSHAEIGDVLGLQPGAVATRLHRVRQALRAKSEEETST
jgi:RNA polymerase sigma-70 factor (ECF subfamily)